MDRNTFISKRTEIVSDMLDHPDECGIYPTSHAFQRLDDLYDQIMKAKVYAVTGWKQVFVVLNIEPSTAHREFMTICTSAEAANRWIETYAKQHESKHLRIEQHNLFTEEELYPIDRPGREL